MTTYSLAQSAVQPGITRSMGMKFMLVCVLALAMTIPSFFVDSLVDDRAHRAENYAKQQSGANAGVQRTFFGTSIRKADAYQSCTRSLKYVLLFLGLVFLTYFVFEAMSGRRAHPAQYLLVGTAQIIFFLLLLSLAERIGFDLAFLVGGGATVALLSANAGWIFASRLQGTRALVVFTLLYTLIYMLLRLQDAALLIGSIASFLAVATAMYLTRKIDWYSQFALPNVREPQTIRLSTD